MRVSYRPLLLMFISFNIFLFILLFDQDAGSGGSSASAAYLQPYPSKYKLSSLSLLQRVLARVEKNYVDPERINVQNMFEKSIQSIERDIPEIMLQISSDKTNLKVIVDTKEKDIPIKQPKTIIDLILIMKNAMAFVEENLHTDLPLQEIEYSLINGMLGTLDPHTILLEPEFAREMDVQIEGEFGGLGITISTRGDDNIITVMNTLPDTPASNSGLKPGDQIIQIEDESTINMTLNEAVSKLRGPVGTIVNILINRQGWDQPKSFAMKRQTIRIDSSESADLGNGISYVHIKTFQHSTYDDMVASLDKFRAENGKIKGLVLDLRHNPGGTLQQAIEVSDRFLESGTIVSTVKSDRQYIEDGRAMARGTEDSYPIVVLVDSESASAAEIVTGALKNLNRAIVVGDQTFGKGSVQNIYSYPDDVKLKLTEAKYLTPGKKWIQSVGIAPDIKLVPVYFDEKVTHFYSTGHIFREKDLDRHFEGTPADSQGEVPFDTIRYFSPKDFRLPDVADAKKDSNTAKNSNDTTNEKAKENEIELPKKPDPKEDFQVQFARDLILKAGRATRQDTITQSKAFVADVKKNKDEELKKEFSNLKLDWMQGGATNSPLNVSISLGENSNDVIKAGDTVKISMQIKNNGTQAVYQVRAITESEIGIFKDMEFLFGKILPGESKSWSREIKIPNSFYSFVEPIVFKVFESGDVFVQEKTVMAKIEERSQPSFAYSIIPIDDGSGKSKGNGDGLIQKGEKIDLAVIIKNLGKVDSEKAFVKIKNKTGKGIYLNGGTSNLKSISTNDWKIGKFSFEVKDTLVENDIKFDFLAGDTSFLRRPKDDIVLPISTTTTNVIQKYQALVKPKSKSAIDIHSGAQEKSQVFARALPNAVMTSTGKLPGWVRVNVLLQSITISGWVEEKFVETTRGTPSSESVFEPIFQYIPPSISYSISKREFTSNEKEVQIDGEVQDDKALESLYVFVNNKKRYLESFPAKIITTNTSVANNATNTPTKKTSFSVKLPLEDGGNTIEFYVRDNDKIQSLDLFQVYKEKSTPVVAGSDASKK